MLGSNRDTVTRLYPGAGILDDLRLMASGVLSPEFGLEGACARLQVPLDQKPQDGSALELTDEEGTPVAQVAVSHAVDLSDDLCSIVGTVCISGQPGNSFNNRLQPPPTDAEGFTTAVVRNPITEVALTQLRELASSGPLTLLVLTGLRAERKVSAEALLRSTVAVANLIGSRVVSVPLGDHAATLEDHVLHRYAPSGWLELDQGSAISSVAAQALHLQPGDRIGLVIFLTGLSGSGKSTISNCLRTQIETVTGRPVTLLDGDVVRRTLSQGLGFSRQDRETNILRIGWVAAEISRHGGIAICCPIAPFDESRKAVRKMVEGYGATFFLTYLKTPVDTCEARDTKGLYAKARRGEVSDFTGLTSPYEPPDDAELVLDTTDEDPSVSVRRVFSNLSERGLVGPQLDKALSPGSAEDIEFLGIAEMPRNLEDSLEGSAPTGPDPRR